MSDFINENILEKIKENNDILDVVSQYVHLKGTGSNYVGLCPFHSEKTPSFTVSPSKGIFHCFGCGEGGDVISFIMKIENLSFVEAVKFLADKSGIYIEEKDKPMEKERNRLFQINRESAYFFYRNLMNNTDARKYLYKRSISDTTINLFKLGFAPKSWDSLEKYLKSKGYKEYEIEKSGLIIKRKDKSGYYDEFRNRIIFPIYDRKNRIIGFGGRVIDDSQPKYLNSPDSLIFSKGHNLFAANLLEKKSHNERIVLVEGYMDVVSLFNKGIFYAVASLGTALTKDQGKLLSKLGDNIYICYDGDEAGLKAADRAIDILKQEDIKAEVIVLPDGKDPDDYIKSYGKEKFESLFENALDYIEYKIFFYERKYNLNDTEEKIAFTRDVGKFLKDVKSPIELDAYMEKISQRTGILKEAIKKEIFGYNLNIENKSIVNNRYINKKYKNNKDNIVPVVSMLQPARLEAERTIVKLMVNNRKVYERVKNFLKPEDFVDEDCKKLTFFLFEVYEKEKDINTKEIIKKLEGKTDVRIENIQKIIHMDPKILPENMGTIVEDLIETIVTSKLKMRRSYLIERISKLDSKNDKKENDKEIVKKLCKELLELDRELKLHQ